MRTVESLEYYKALKKQHQQNIAVLTAEIDHSKKSVKELDARIKKLTKENV